MNTTPILLFDIDNKTLGFQIVARSNSFFIRSYQNFNISIIGEDVENNMIYSAKLNEITSEVDIQEGFNLTGNSSYTVYLESKMITIGVSSDLQPEIVTYEIHLMLENELTDEQNHYEDIRINYHLPSFEQIEPAMLFDEDRRDLLKRMLLDFRVILSRKGTTLGLQKYLNFIGFDYNDIRLFEEFLKPNQTLTIVPDKSTDRKTGNYHLFIDNFDETMGEGSLQMGLTRKNLPSFKLKFKDFDELFDKLVYAISIANVYFTLPEQDINFVGFANQANGERFLSITNESEELFHDDIHEFHKRINIDMWYHINSNLKNYLVKDKDYQIDYATNQKIFNIAKKFVRTYGENQTFFLPELHFVDDEIYDDFINPGYDITKITTIFGNVMHMKIDVPENCYCNFVVFDTEQPLSRIEMIEQNFDRRNYSFVWFSKNSTRYKVVVTIFDAHNNRERYEYFYDLSLGLALSKIDFNILTSAKIFDDTSIKFDELNLKKDTDRFAVVGTVSSPQLSKTKTLNPILTQENTPTDLAEYFSVEIQGNNTRYLTDSEMFFIKEINKNFLINKSTDTIPVDFMDNTLDVRGIRIKKGYKLKILVVDDWTGKEEYLDINDPKAYVNIPDKLFVTVMDIVVEDGEPLIDEITGLPVRDAQGNIKLSPVAPYFFISTTEPGINIIPNLYDLYVFNELDQMLFSVWDQLIPDNTATVLALQEDIGLFHAPSDSYPDYIRYPFMNYGDQILIRSIYPRLCSIDEHIDKLKLGDIIYCNINANYIPEDLNFEWKIYNAFTKKLLFSTKEYSLKYRINENIIYDIVLKCNIDDIEHEINRKSVVSSY